MHRTAVSEPSVVSYQTSDDRYSSKFIQHWPDTAFSYFELRIRGSFPHFNFCWIMFKEKGLDKTERKMEEMIE